MAGYAARPRALARVTFALCAERLMRVETSPQRNEVRFSDPAGTRIRTNLTVTGIGGRNLRRPALHE